LTTNGAAADPAQRDLAWLGYHPFALAPAFVLAVVASLILWTGRWYLSQLSDLANRVGTPATFAMAWGVWPALLFLFLYRSVTYTYRLTDRAVLVEFGFLARPVHPIQLADVTAVATGGSWLARRSGVGWVEVRTPDRAVRLTGVRKASGFAIAIREAVEKAKSVR
jgi:uncharacterized membrane protein YdbT with pleckstrin-like domain